MANSGKLSRIAVLKKLGITAVSVDLLYSGRMYVCVYVCVGGVQVFDYISCRTVDNLHHQPPVDAVRRATDVSPSSDDTITASAVSLSLPSTGSQ